MSYRSFAGLIGFVVVFVLKPGLVTQQQLLLPLETLKYGPLTS
jgi:hypothetical protein